MNRRAAITLALRCLAAVPFLGWLLPATIIVRAGETRLLKTGRYRKIVVLDGGTLLCGDGEHVVDIFEIHAGGTLKVGWDTEIDRLDLCGGICDITLDLGIRA